MSCDDKELLNAYVHQKDAEAFAALVDRYQALVYATGLRQLRNGTDAEDISQEVFLSLARNADQIVTGNLGGWLYRCALNAANSKLRSDRARVERERVRVAPDGRPNASIEWRQIEEVLDVCLAELDSDSRELVIQRFFANRSQNDLAAAFGVDQATVSRRLKKAVDQLRRRMAGRGVRLTVAAIAATLAESARGATVPSGLSASLTKIGVAGVGRQLPGAATRQVVWQLPLTIGIATVASIVVVATLVGTLAGRSGGPTTAVAGLARPPRFGVVAGMRRLDYSQSVSSSALAIGDQGEVALFNDRPAERAGVYVVGNNGIQRVHRLPDHRRRALALRSGPVVAVSYDAHVGVLDNDTIHPLSETGAIDVPPSINRQGWVAFIETAPVSRIRLAAADGVHTLHQAGDRFARFDEVVINDEDQIAFRAETTRGDDVLCVSQRGDVTVIAEVGDAIKAFRPWFDFNNRGQVAFVAELADGSEAIFLGDADGLDQIAQTGAYFASILQVSVNNAGSIVFTARRPSDPAELPIAGLYWWDGHRVVKVLPRGEQVRGRTLQGALLWRDSLNDAGQFAVMADLGPDELAEILRLDTRDLTVAD